MAKPNKPTKPSQLEEENAQLRDRLARAHENHDKLLHAHLLSMRSIAGVASLRAEPPMGGTAGIVWQIVWDLSDDKNNVRFNRTLSSLDVPFETLARRLNARFFGSADRLSASRFNKTTTVGDVVTIVEEEQERTK